MNTLCCHVEVISHPFSAGLCAEATHTICSNLSACKLLDQHSPPCTDRRTEAHSHTHPFLHLFSTLVALPSTTTLVSFASPKRLLENSLEQLRPHFHVAQPFSLYRAWRIRNSVAATDLSPRSSTNALVTIFTSTVRDTTIRPFSQAEPFNTILETRASHEHSPFFPITRDPCANFDLSPSLRGGCQLPHLPLSTTPSSCLRIVGPPRPAPVIAHGLAPSEPAAVWAQTVERQADASLPRTSTFVASSQKLPPFAMPFGVSKMQALKPSRRA